MFNEILIGISVILMICVFIAFPFIPLFMLVLADEFGVLDEDEGEEHE